MKYNWRYNVEIGFSISGEKDSDTLKNIIDEVSKLNFSNLDINKIEKGRSTAIIIEDENI